MDRVPESVEAYFARIDASADASGRLGWVDADGASAWDIFPYEEDGLLVKPLRGPVATEPPRRGEDPAECWCARAERPADALWGNDRWYLQTAPSGLPFFGWLSPVAHHDLTDLPPDLAAELGVLAVALAAAVEDLPSVGRAHLNKWGDGGAHLHLCVLGRPARVLQLCGSCLPDWMEHLPPLPEEVAAANHAAVVAGLVARAGGTAYGP